MSIVEPTSTWFEQGFAEQNAKQDWLRALQNNAAEVFSQRGLPSRREEAWKYTDTTFLAQKNYKMSAVMPANNPIAEYQLQQADCIMMVFINGHYMESLSQIDLLPNSVTLCSLKDALDSSELKAILSQTVDAQRYPFAVLNTALLQDGLFLSIPKNTVLKTPIHFLYLNTETSGFAAHSRNIIKIDEQSQVTILEEHVGQQADDYFTNVQTDIYAGRGAQVDYHKIQNESKSAVHIAQTFIYQQQDSQVNLTSLSDGARLARDDIYLRLSEQGASVSLKGFYALNQDDQHCDYHIHADHLAAYTMSEMHYKGILDKKSQAVFNGKVYVAADAQKIQSNQSNHNLLLSTQAQVATKPELEIYADDVKCAHGATVGQLDKDALFYLQSRGIDEKTALQILNRAFAADVLDKVKHPAIARQFQRLLTQEFGDENEFC